MGKIKLVSTIILAVVVFFLCFRAFSDIELDDVHPGIACDFNLIEKSDILWVVPLFKNDSIASNPIWCKSILSLNKTLGLHGVYHTYNEFQEERSDKYLESGINAFEQCFNQTPRIFKAPQLAYNDSNDLLLQQHRLWNKEKVNQLLHKVYHCSDTGEFPNEVIGIL